MRKQITYAGPGKTNLDWGDLSLLLVVGQTGSIRKAAEIVGQTQSTLGRRLDALELRLGVRLLVRDKSGARLTEAGEMVADRALTMARSVAELEDLFATLDREVAGDVTISCGEALAAPFLAPRLTQLGQHHPKLRITMSTALPVKEPGSGESDVSIMYFDAKNMDSIAVRLGTVHYCLFGTQAYFDVYGPVVDVAEQVLGRHRVITHTSLRTHDRNWSDRAENIYGLANTVVFMDSSACVVETVANGAGLAMMPSFAGLYDERLVMVDAPPLVKVPFWLVYRESMRRAARIRIVADWIKSAFDRSQNPWFRDEFVHPCEFGEVDLPRNIAA